MFPDQQHVQVLSAVWKQRRCKRGSIITQNALRLWAQVSVQHKHVSFSRWALRPWARSAGWINTSVMETVRLLQQCILGGRNQHLHLKAQSAVFSLIFKCDDHNLFQIWRKTYRIYRTWSFKLMNIVCDSWHCSHRINTLSNKGLIKWGYWILISQIRASLCVSQEVWGGAPLLVVSGNTTDLIITYWSNWYWLNTFFSKIKTWMFKMSWG